MVFKQEVQTLNSLKVFGICWRRLYRVLDSCVVIGRYWPKNVCTFWNNVATFISL